MDAAGDSLEVLICAWSHKTCLERLYRYCIQVQRDREEEREQTPSLTSAGETNVAHEGLARSQYGK